jgi:hypothetical protein
MAAIAEYVPESLNLHARKPVQIAIEACDDMSFNPLTSLDNCSTVQFLLPSYPGRYIDTNNIFLKTHFQVVKSGGELYTNKDAKQPAAIANMGHSMFKNATVELGGKIVSSSRHYNTKSYMLNTLNYQKPAIETKLHTQGHWADTAGKMDSAADENHGAKSRRAKTKDSKIFETYFKVDMDVFRQPKQILDGVDMKLSFELENNKFFFMKESDDTSSPDLKILECTLFARYLTISRPVLVAHQQLLASANVRYDFLKDDLKTFLIPSGVSSHNIENIFSGQLPKNVVISFVENGAFTGDFAKNPFNYQLFGLNSIQLNVNGSNVPNSPILLDGSAGHVAHAYYNTYSALNCQNKDFGLSFGEHAFRNGYGMFAFDLTASKQTGAMDLHNNSGNMKIDLKFKDPLTNPVVMLVYGEFDSYFEVNANREVIVNY